LDIVVVDIGLAGVDIAAVAGTVDTVAVHMAVVDMISAN